MTFLQPATLLRPEWGNGFYFIDGQLLSLPGLADQEGGRH